MIDTFDKKGWMIIKNVLGETQRTELCAHIQSIQKGYDTAVGTDKLKERTSLLLYNSTTAQNIIHIFKHYVVQAFITDAYSKPIVEHTKVLIKAAGAPETPWHQDAGFWKAFDPDVTMFTVWIALKDVNKKNGCLRILDADAEKLKTWYPHTPIHNGQERELEKETLTKLLRQYKVVDCPLQAGDALVFKSWVIHMAYPNHSDQERIACKVVFQDYQKRPKEYPTSTRSVTLYGVRGLFNRLTSCGTTRAHILMQKSISSAKKRLGSVVHSI